MRIPFHLFSAVAGFEIETTGKFGENVIVEGLNERNVCVGDRFLAPSGLQIQVASPRKPCSRIDQTLGQKYGLQGVRHHCLSQTRAGWFCRVLQPGTLAKGDRLTLMRRPHPEWSLYRVGQLIYGGSGADQQPVWRGTEAERHALLSIPEFGRLDWKEHLES